MKKLFLLLLCTLAVSQTEWTTRVYETEPLNTYDTFDIRNLDSSLEELNYYQIRIIDVLGMNIGGGDYTLRLEQDNNTLNRIYITCEPGGCYYAFNGSGSPPNPTTAIFTSPILRFDTGATWNNLRFLIAVTAEFPIEDTGYLEENFEYCVDPGYNLISYPCDSPIAITDAIPYEVTSNMSSVIGEGTAGINVNGNWIGSLSEMQPGSGYWLSASTSMCFNFDCQQ